ncbi:family 43 glycosylhydrolase [Prevotella sp.]|uniref:family 43 glycosylhydrolase n=1 Tax=Prevotella sp. TaxID=59823 RepID=UPI00264984C6|nr:family 43 glycosylhydrolase [Prevotella sp.]MDN5552479.1 family 43 glycosylhydrolase [Prevotella sp.]
MRNKTLKTILYIILLFSSITVSAWEGMAMPQLHVEGRYFKDSNGNIVNLHGFAQTYSPWFNERGTKWNNYDVNACLTYNQGLINDILNAGWKVNFLRLHMDPYWSNTPGIRTTGENDISAFDYDRFTKYFQSVFVPMAKYAISHGLYVIMRPPGVCPESIAVGDAYQQYLIKVWNYVSADSYIKNNPNIMFELANEPVRIWSDGKQAGFKELSEYFQTITNTIRANCNNIVLVPGLSYQANYAGFADYPIKGENIGYAVHCYPGWYNSGSENTPNVNYQLFNDGWNKQIKPISDLAPIVVTEMDWAPEKYNSSFGKGVTGTVGGTGFGANFKKITDDCGNVSWLIFTTPELLAQFKDEQGNGDTFLTDNEACPWPAYHWYQDYANKQYPHTDFTFKSCSDNGDGTFTNPVIQADFPDPDVQKVGDTYYMVTTTMHNFPGCTLLKSKDLVNWEYCCNPLEKMSVNAEYNLEDGKNIYSKGAWANSLMYKNGKFYILFNAFGNGDDAGGYLLSATNAEGPWTMARLSRGYYDPGLMTDEDGTTYVVCGNGNLKVIQLDDNFAPVKEADVDGGFDGLEGSHFFKKDGYYYIYSTCCAWPATQWCFRSKNVFGPYEKKEVFNSDDIHQGAMIQTQSGEWWTMLMKDCGAFGRMPYLLPVTWNDNWPVIGNNGVDAGTYTKPNVGVNYDRKYMPTNDNFKNYLLGSQWQWNHNPDKAKWSLLENPGRLRLYTASVTDSLQKSRNMLTQRIFGYRDNTKPSYGTIRMNISKMYDRDMAGIAVFQNPYAYIAINKQGSNFNLVQSNTADKKVYSNVIACDSVIYLRAVADIATSKATFYYSLDNVTYTKFGQDLDMKYNLSVFVGNRFGIFNYATKELGGHVDVDWFSTEKDFSEDTFYDKSSVAHSESYLTAVSISADKPSYSLLTNSAKSFVLTATYKDGHTEDITSSANYKVSNDKVVGVKNARLTSYNEGNAVVTASYNDALGNTVSTNINIFVNTFPLTAAGINPSIYASGAFDESTHTLVTGQYGFGGWEYTNGVDFSSYKYIVIELNKAQSNGASFRLFDENSYWSSPSMTDIGSSTTVRIELAKLVKNKTTTPLDLSHIYIAGFWSLGGGDISIKNIFFSNDGDTPVTGIQQIEETDKFVDVYNLSGMLLYSKLKMADVFKKLSKGVYIISGKCVAIK